MIRLEHINCDRFAVTEIEHHSRVDLGNKRYGGPFTTEEVETENIFEDFKSFVVTWTTVCNLTDQLVVCYLYSQHTFSNTHFHVHLTFSVHVSPHHFILVAIYVMLLRPLMSKYFPGTLMRIGIGIVFLVIPTFCYFVLDVVVHTCILSGYVDMHFSDNDTYTYDRECLSQWNISFVSILELIQCIYSFHVSLKKEAL